MVQKSSKERQEIEFSAAEAYRICKLYQEEDVLWNQNLADNSKSEKKYPRYSPALAALAINSIHKRDNNVAFLHVENIPRYLGRKKSNMIRMAV